MKSIPFFLSVGTGSVFILIYSKYLNKSVFSRGLSLVMFAAVCLSGHLVKVIHSPSHAHLYLNECSWLFFIFSVMLIKQLWLSDNWFSSVVVLQASIGKLDINSVTVAIGFNTICVKEVSQHYTRCVWWHKTHQRLDSKAVRTKSGMFLSLLTHSFYTIYIHLYTG